MMATKTTDEFTGRMFEAINGMLLDMLAAVARKDYDYRRRRQAQGQAKAKLEGRYKGLRGRGLRSFERKPDIYPIDVP
jgi:DNA invertase Pin-like site-specific DNA recombinase